MSNKPINTLLELLSRYTVEVPIIQRDYAQGRQDEHAKMVRKNLLNDMKSAIMRTTHQLDLNFVYGKVEENIFIPTDGQQRLTTLFLLHVYAFCNDDSKTEILQHFSYKTRVSSRKFLEELIKNRSAIFASTLFPSEEIEDSDWFVAEWKRDPTIQSALIMLDDVRNIFEEVENLDKNLSNQEFTPVVFRFLVIEELGMEDTQNIKLNARGKPLTHFENFKAQLIGRLQELNPPFTKDFEQCFDGKWTDLFWLQAREHFDKTYLAFFGILLRNKELCKNDDAHWANSFDYKMLELETFETIYYVLNFLSVNTNSNVYLPLFNALEKLRFQDRVLFHAITTYLYKSKGLDTDSLTQWYRIFQNLVLNSQIDSEWPYYRAIEGINKLADNWDALLEYFSKKETAQGFLKEQIEEEQIKAQIILQDNIFAIAIYEAEKHPYFSGQIRSALYYAKNNTGSYDRNIFCQYWSKISSLFEDKKPNHGHLLRRALLTFGDYTLPVENYKTLCVDDPNEGASTPSLKKLFSSCTPIVKKLLDTLNSNTTDFENQLKAIVTNANLPKNDWRHCFIKFPELFESMSDSHLRLRHVGNNLLIIPHKASNGYNLSVFLFSLHLTLKQNAFETSAPWFLGTWADYYLSTTQYVFIRFNDGKFTIKDKDVIVFETKTDDPISEAVNYLTGNHQ